jgi:hypothetical protein
MNISWHYADGILRKEKKREFIVSCVTMTYLHTHTKKRELILIFGEQEEILFVFLIKVYFSMVQKMQFVNR